MGTFSARTHPGREVFGRRPLVARLGHQQTIGAIGHRLCRLIWKILHQRLSYEERGPAVTKHRAQRRAAKMIRELRSLGYRVELLRSPSGGENSNPCYLSDPPMMAST